MDQNKPKRSRIIIQNTINFMTNYINCHFSIIIKSKFQMSVKEILEFKESLWKNEKEKIVSFLQKHNVNTFYHALGVVILNYFHI